MDGRKKAVAENTLTSIVRRGETQGRAGGGFHSYSYFVFFLSTC